MTDPTNSRKLQLEPTVDATAVRPGVDATKKALGEIGRAGQKAGDDAAAGLDKIPAAGQKAATQVERDTKSLIGSIERATAAFKAGARGSSEYFEELGKQRGISGDALKPYIEQLRAAELAQKTAAQGLGKMEISAKQTAAALRGVPAQFTDIVTALQGGQNPLTVFLQQGGQLKDTFGGAGAAARALGGYVAGLVGPVTIATAAVGALAFGLHQGAEEGLAFNRTLILTGNQVGATADQMARAAQSVRSFEITQGAASDAINQLAATGKVGADNLGRFASAAIRLQQVGGPAVEETVKAFAELGKEPLKAALKLNESTNFLTASLYEQIRALEEQGRTTEAARVAQEAFAASNEERIPRLTENVGLLERAWVGVKNVIKGVGDDLASIGRADTIADLEKRLNNAQIQAREAGPAGLIAVLADNKVRALREELAAAKEVEALSRRAAETSAAQKREIDARVEAEKVLEQMGIKRLSQAQQEDALRAKLLAGKAAEKDIEAAIAALREKNKDKGAASADRAALRALEQEASLLDRLAGLTGTYAEDLKRLQSIKQRTSMTDERYVELVKELIQKQPFAIDLAKQQAEAYKQVADAEARGLALHEQRITALDQSADAAAKQVQAMRDEAEAAALAARSNISLAQAIQEVVIARLQEQQRQAAGDELAVATIQREIDKRRELIALIGSQEMRDAAKKSAEDASREWERASADIERGLTDALIRGFDSGKGMAESLRDYIVNLFKTTVVKFAVQALIGNSGSSFGGQGSGGLGWAGDGLSAFGNWMGGDSTIGNWASTAGSLLKGNGTTVGAGGSLFGVAGSAFSGGTALANAGLAGQALQGGWASIGAGNVAQGVGQIGGVAAGALGGFLGGRAVGQLVSGGYAAGGGSGNSAVNTGAAIGAAVGSIIPGLGTLIGGLIGGALGGAVNRAFGHKPKEYGDMGLEGTISAGDVSGQTYAEWLRKGGWFRSDKRGTDYLGIDSELETGLDVGAKAILDNAKAWGAALALPGDQLASVTTTFKAKLTGNAQEDEAAIAAALQTYSNALIDSFGGQLAPFKAGTETTAQTLERLAVSLGSVNGVLDILGQSLLTVGVTGADAASQLLNQFGGLQQFQAAGAQYLQDYYSEAERTALATQQLTAQLATVGLAVPASRDAYRDLVEAQDLNTEAGRKAYAALLQLAPGFAQLVPAITGLGNAATEAARQAEQAAEAMAEAGRRALTQLAEDQGSLQVELLRVQGDLVGAAQLARQQALAKLTEGLSAQDAAAATAAYTFNDALREQIAAFNAASAAAEAETQRLQAVAAERASLEQRLLQLQGDTAALRALELNATDAANRAILERIFALEDSTAAEQAAAAAQASIANERESLVTRLLQAQGNTAALRERELAALDPSNRALLEQIHLLEDQKAAAQAAAEAAAQAQQQAQQAAQAAEQLRQSWQSVTDSLFAEARRIRGLNGANSPQSLTAAQALFYTTTAQARAGDQDAAKLLPSLSEAMLSLAQAQMASAADLRLLRAQTAASLSTTASQVVGQYGLSLPKLHDGTNNVPTTMAAILHPGEAVVPRAFNPAMGAGARESELLEELRGLRADQRVQAAAMVRVQSDLFKLQKKWDQTGLPQEREEVTA